MKARGATSLGAIGALSISLALVCPTLVLAANGQAVTALTDWPIWMVFGLGAVCIALVAYSIARMVAGLGGGASAYHIVTVALGARAGRCVGLILCGTYVCFAVATPSASTGFIEDLAGGAPFGRLAWGAVAAAVSVAALAVLRLGSAAVARILLGIEGAGIVLLAVLACAVLAAHDAGSAPVAVVHHGGAGFLPAVVVAFLSWAGFESCLSVTSEIRDPRRDIPRSLYGTVGLTAVLFVGMFWVIQHGFMHRLGGMRGLADSQDALASVGVAYLGRWSALAFGLAAFASSFAGLIAPLTAAAHLLSSLYPRRLGAGNRALWATGAVVVAAQCVIPWVPGLGASPVATYGLVASCGAVCIMVAYQVVQVGFARAVWRGVLAGRRAELAVPVCGLGLIGLVIATSLTQGGSALAATLVALGWCAGVAALEGIRRAVA